MEKVLYIYAFYAGDACRIRNLTASIDQLIIVNSGADICIVEQNGFTPVNGVKFHHTIDIPDSNFHKTALLNNAVNKHPEYDLYVMIDADSWIDGEIIDNIIRHGKDAPLVFPYSNCVYLNEAETRIKCRHSASAIKMAYNSNIPITRQSGLINCFSKSTYDAVGGFDEEFSGWGAEDDAFIFKVRRKFNLRELRCSTGTVLHMWHRKANDASYLSGERYTKNRAYCSIIRRMTDSEFSSYIAGTISLETMYEIFSAENRMEGYAVIKIGDGTTLKIDTSIYFLRTFSPTITEVLETILEEDGQDYVKSFIKKYITPNSIYESVLSDVNAFLETHCMSSGGPEIK